MSRTAVIIASFSRTALTVIPWKSKSGETSR